MVSSPGLSALACAVVGLGCAISAVHGDRGEAGAVVRIAEAPAPEPAAAPPPSAAPRPAAAAVDADLPTGSIAPGSALHQPNPAAYRGAGRMGDPVTVTGEEAINYLAGNTLRREGPGEAPRSTYFASRGVLAEGDERNFTARHWDRERPELCDAGTGATPCRSVSILLDGKYEFPGARLGTVTLGAAGGRPAETAALIKGNVLHVPEHIPTLDSTVDAGAGAAAAAAPARGDDPVAAIAGHVVEAAVDGERGRQLVFYGGDDRRLELRQTQAGDGRAVEVTVGHWRGAKAGLCQARAIGAPQTCFKAEAGAAGVRLVPAGRGGEAQTLTVLPETGARAVAQD